MPTRTFEDRLRSMGPETVAKTFGLSEVITFSHRPLSAEAVAIIDRAKALMYAEPGWSIVVVETHRFGLVDGIAVAIQPRTDSDHLTGEVLGAVTDAKDEADAITRLQLIAEDHGLAFVGADHKEKSNTRWALVIPTREPTD